MNPIPTTCPTHPPHHPAASPSPAPPTLTPPHIKPKPQARPPSTRPTRPPITPPSPVPPTPPHANQNEARKSDPVNVPTTTTTPPNRPTERGTTTPPTAERVRRHAHRPPIRSSSAKPAAVGRGSPPGQMEAVMPGAGGFGCVVRRRPVGLRAFRILTFRLFRRGFGSRGRRPCW